MPTLPTLITLHRAEFPGDRYATVMVLIENAAGAPPHTHPGLEMTYILDGEFTLSVDGRAERRLNHRHGLRSSPKADEIPTSRQSDPSVAGLGHQENSLHGRLS